MSFREGQGKKKTPPLSGTFERSHGIFLKHREVKRSRSNQFSREIFLATCPYCSSCCARDVHVLRACCASEPVQTGSNWFKPIQTGSNRFRPVQTGKNPGKSAPSAVATDLCVPTRLVFFDIGQSLLVDFCLCASTRLVFFTLVSR